MNVDFTQKSLQSLNLLNLRLSYTSYNPSGRITGYIKLTKDGDVIITQKKEMQLHEVFEAAKKKIESDYTILGKSIDINTRIDVLQKLQKNGKANYEYRYLPAINSWSRCILKGLARYTPEFAKPFLPTCFSNKMAEAEKKTKEQYEIYNQFIENQIKILNAPAGK